MTDHIEHNKLSTTIFRYGSEKPLPTPRALRAGPLSALYVAGGLRYIRLHGREVLRRVYVAVRDQNWVTVPDQITNEQIEADEHSFRISYNVANRQGDIDLLWHGVITGAADGTICFAMDGTAHSTFLANRIGFCVLHPASCAGARSRIGHIDGSVEASEFPQAIAPQRVENGQIHPVYPFAEMRALSHEVEPGVWAALCFAGETFELEDQRNWIDGSYKTYGTPLRLPFPARLTAGTPIRQSVTLSLKDERGKVQDAATLVAVAPSSSIPPPATFTLLASSLPLPPFGLGTASHGEALSAVEIARLRALRPAHLRVDLRLAEANSRDALRRAVDEAQALGAPIEAALFLSNDAPAELARLRASLEKLRPPIVRWLIFHNDEKSTAAAWVRLAREQLGSYAPAVPFASGTNVYFTELNRARPDPTALDQVVYSVSPQVHAFDNDSLVECAEMIAATVESAHTFSGGRPVLISPVTLKPRFNPNATGPELEPPPGELPPHVDVRQMSLFGAAWTLAALKYLGESGVASATLYETTGWRGVMETAEGSPGDGFPALPGTVFPLYHVLADVNDFAGGEVVCSRSSDPLTVDGLVLRRGAATRLLLANMTNEAQRVRIELPLRLVAVHVLDERIALDAMRAPEAFRAAAAEPMLIQDGALELELLPYAIARLDSAPEKQ